MCIRDSVDVVDRKEHGPGWSGRGRRGGRRRDRAGPGGRRWPGRRAGRHLPGRCDGHRRGRGRGGATLGAKDEERGQADDDDRDGRDERTERPTSGIDLVRPGSLRAERRRGREVGLVEAHGLTILIEVCVAPAGTLGPGAEILMAGAGPTRLTATPCARGSLRGILPGRSLIHI